MRYFKRILNFYLDASIHVALAVFVLAWITLIQFELAYDKNCLYFIFFASITGYNFVKYFGVAKFHHRSLANWLKVIQVFSLIAFLTMLYYGFKLQVNTHIIIAILGLITFLYAIPLIPKNIFIDHQKNLREIGGLKIYVIAFVWAFTTVVIPLINSNVAYSTDILITGIQRFCFVMALMLPFEIRDLNYDSIKLSTIPQKIGIKYTKICGVLLLMVFMMLEFFKDELTGNTVITTFGVTFLTTIFLMLSKKNQSKYFSAFWVESLPLFWLVILLMLN